MQAVLSVLTPFFVVAAVLGGLVLGLCAKVYARDRTVLTITLFSYIAHVGVALFLFSASYWGWNVIPSLQMGRGFWFFSPDATGYHVYGAEIANAWAGGGPVRDPGTHIEYYALVASIYALMGVHPLHPIIFNCFLSAASGLAAFFLTRKFFQPAAAKLTCFLVSFWPSTFIWSSQLLKDSVCWFLIFTIFLSVCLLRQGKAQNRWDVLKWAGQCFLLGVMIIILTRFRPYLGVSLILASLLVWVPVFVYTCSQKRYGAGFKTLFVAAFIVLSVLGARTLDTFAWVSSLGKAGRPSVQNVRTVSGKGLSAPVFTVSPQTPRTKGGKKPHIDTLTDISEDARPLPASHARDVLHTAAVPGTPENIRPLPEPPAIIQETLASQAAYTAGEMTPIYVGKLRQGFVNTGGHALVDARARISDIPSLLKYLPRALAVGYLAPFPSQWLDTQGSTGIMRVFSGAEMLLVYCLLPFVVLNGVRRIRSGSMESIFILIFVLVLSSAMSSVVANMGTLFRLRLLFWLPLLVFAADGWPVRLVQKFFPAGTGERP